MDATTLSRKSMQCNIAISECKMMLASIMPSVGIIDEVNNAISHQLAYDKYSSIVMTVLYPPTFSSFAWRFTPAYAKLLSSYRLNL